MNSFLGSKRWCIRYNFHRNAKIQEFEVFADTSRPFVDESNLMSLTVLGCDLISFYHPSLFQKQKLNFLDTFSVLFLHNLSALSRQKVSN